MDFNVLLFMSTAFKRGRSDSFVPHGTLHNVWEHFWFTSSRGGGGGRIQLLPAVHLTAPIINTYLGTNVNSSAQLCPVSHASLLFPCFGQVYSLQQWFQIKCRLIASVLYIYIFLIISSLLTPAYHSPHSGGETGEVLPRNCLFTSRYFKSGALTVFK